MSVHKYFLPPAAPGGKPRARWRVNFDLPPHPDGTRRRGTRKGFTTRSKAVDVDLELRGRRAAGTITLVRKDWSAVGDIAVGSPLGGREITVRSSERLIIHDS